MTTDEIKAMVRRDWLSVDVTEPMTYFARQADDSFPDAGIPVTGRFLPPTRQIGGPGAAGVSNTIELDAIPLAGVFVGPMGRIVRADGSKWAVSSANGQNFETLWSCEVYQEAEDDADD